ncbi:MAG TPA: DUF1569 domain-containing protein [Casimicrobiaceae bacterium]|jgi:hypothetical protein|nr:DUF1569 domain-containing protein [Casimicrobiaceae bacterium]
MRRPIRVLVPAILLMALSVYLSFAVFREWRDAAGSGQRVATITQAAYCILGVLAGWAALWRRSALGTLLGFWLLAVTATAGLAPVVWGGQSWLVGIVSAITGGAIAALIAGWLMSASAPSLWEPSARRELGARVRRLTPGSPAGWGRMTCSQMLIHVNDQLKMSLGDLPAKQERLPVRFPPLKQLIVYTFPFSRGLPTSPELIARMRSQVSPVWDSEIATFDALVERFGQLPKHAKWPTHPAFGRMSRLAWGVLGYKHTDHHFRQFGV